MKIANTGLTHICNFLFWSPVSGPQGPVEGEIWWLVTWEEEARGFKLKVGENFLAVFPDSLGLLPSESHCHTDLAGHRRGRGHGDISVKWGKSPSWLRVIQRGASS